VIDCLDRRTTVPQRVEPHILAHERATFHHHVRPVVELFEQRGEVDKRRPGDHAVGYANAFLDTSCELLRTPSLEQCILDTETGGDSGGDLGILIRFVLVGESIEIGI